MKMTVIPIVIGAHGTVTKRLIQGLEDLKIRGRVETSKRQHYRDLPKKSPGDLRKLAITQTPMRNH